jgi:hypothetical protein
MKKGIVELRDELQTDPSTLAERAEANLGKGQGRINRNGNGELAL